MGELSRTALGRLATQAVDSNAVHKCLWTPEYSEDTWQCAYRFVTECCWTKDDANVASPIQLIPAKSYIAWMVYEWWLSRKTGEPILLEKSRRMIATWLFAALDVWDAGLRGGVYCVAAQKYQNSAKLIYRRYFIYQQLRRRRPSWGLPSATKYHSGGPDQLKKLIIGGAIFEPLTGEDPDSFRQEGVTRVILDEFAFFPYPEKCFSNARVMVTPPPGVAIGGQVLGITTVNVTPSYLRMVKEGKEPEIKDMSWGNDGVQEHVYAQSH